MNERDFDQTEEIIGNIVEWNRQRSDKDGERIKRLLERLSREHIVSWPKVTISDASGYPAEIEGIVIYNDDLCWYEYSLILSKQIPDPEVLKPTIVLVKDGIYKFPLRSHRISASYVKLYPEADLAEEVELTDYFVYAQPAVNKMRELMQGQAVPDAIVNLP